MTHLYRVTITLDTIVAADDPGEACLLARQALRDGDLNDEEAAICLVPLTSLVQLPRGWDAGCIPWGTSCDDSETIGELLAAQKAEP